MITNGKASFLCNTCLALLNGWVHEFLHMTTIDAHDMIMMITPVQFKHCLPTLEVVAIHEACCFKLG